MAGKVAALVIGLVVLFAAVIFICFSYSVFKGMEKKSAGQNVVPALNANDRSFIVALENSDAAAAGKALQANPNLNLVDPANGYSSLLLVLKNIDDIILTSGQINKSQQEELQFWQNLAEKIVDAGADVNGNGNWGHIPLEQADTPWTVEFLLRHRAKVDINVYSGTPLYWHANDYDADIEKLLLEAGADPNIKNYQGRTPLHKAAADEAVKIIPLLLQYGAAMNQKDEMGYTPLTLAIALHRYLAIELLQKDGAAE